MCGGRVREFSLSFSPPLLPLLDCWKGVIDDGMLREGVHVWWGGGGREQGEGERGARRGEEGAGGEGREGEGEKGDERAGDEGGEEWGRWAAAGERGLGRNAGEEEKRRGEEGGDASSLVHAPPLSPSPRSL